MMWKIQQREQLAAEKLHGLVIGGFENHLKTDTPDSLHTRVLSIAPPVPEQYQR